MTTDKEPTLKDIIASAKIRNKNAHVTVQVPESSKLGRGLITPVMYLPADVSGRVDPPFDGDYTALLEHSYAEQCRFEDSMNNDDSYSRLEYLAEQIFEFVTYAGDMSVFFARKAVEVCTAITERKTFEYIKDDENHKWYLAMCNMPFFAERINWGTSIRGAWWDYEFPPIESCGLYVGQEQLLKLPFTSQEEWVKFIRAVIQFAQPEMVT